jgi:hypothetical protein
MSAGVLVTYLRVSLSAVTAAILALLGAAVGRTWLAADASKATGLAAVAGGALEGVFNPWVWLLAFALFAVLVAISRLRSGLLRAVLFWVPATAVSTLGLAGCAWFAYALGQVRNR